MTDFNRRNMLKALVALGGATVLGVPGVRAQAEQLVITTYGGSWEKFWRDILIPAFTEESGVEPQLDIGLGRVYTTNLRAAGKDNPPYSCLMTNEIYSTVLSEALGWTTSTAQYHLTFGCAILALTFPKTSSRKRRQQTLPLLMVRMLYQTMHLLLLRELRRLMKRPRITWSFYNTKSDIGIYEAPYACLVTAALDQLKGPHSWDRKA